MVETQFQKATNTLQKIKQYFSLELLIPWAIIFASYLITDAIKDSKKSEPNV